MLLASMGTPLLCYGSPLFYIFEAKCKNFSIGEGTGEYEYIYTPIHVLFP